MNKTSRAYNKGEFHRDERDKSLATLEYESLMEAVDEKLAAHRNITYIPFTQEQQLAKPKHFDYGDRSNLREAMSCVDAVVCISRDETIIPHGEPNRNIELTPSGCANVDTSVEVFKAAFESNPSVQFISTGRMHNRAIPMMLALPLVAEFVDMNAEDAYHIPEAEFEKRVRRAFSSNEYALRLERLLEQDDTGVLKRNFLSAVQKAVGNDIIVPADKGDEEQLLEFTDAFISAYKAYPRISTSRLMLEEAVEKGVPLEAIWEEDGAVDTITNIVNIAHMLENIAALKNLRTIAIVAGSDHLPRTTWITDHILPDDIDIIFIESDPRLSVDEYATSCAREQQSFQKGSNWIGGTRKLQEIENITHVGYFERFSPEKIAAEVAAIALKDTKNQS